MDTPEVKQFLNQATEAECKQCGSAGYAWQEDAKNYICFDCFACNEEHKEVEWIESKTQVQAQRKECGEQSPVFEKSNTQR